MWNTAGRRAPRDGLVERIGELVVREEGLQVGVELEPARALRDEPTRLLDGVAPVRIDRHERDQNVAVRRGDLQDLVVGDRHLARCCADCRRKRPPRPSTARGSSRRPPARSVAGSPSESAWPPRRGSASSADRARRAAAPARGCARRWRERPRRRCSFELQLRQPNAVGLKLRGETRLPDRRDRVGVPAAVAQLGRRSPPGARRDRGGRRRSRSPAR